MRPRLFHQRTDDTKPRRLRFSRASRRIQATEHAIFSRSALGTRIFLVPVPGTRFPLPFRKKRRPDSDPGNLRATNCRTSTTHQAITRASAPRFGIPSPGPDTRASDSVVVSSPAPAACRTEERESKGSRAVRGGSEQPRSACSREAGGNDRQTADTSQTGEPSPPSAHAQLGLVRPGSHRHRHRHRRA